MARRAKLVVAPAAEELAEGAPGADEGEELFEEELPPQVVTTVSVPRSSPPSSGLPLFPKLPAGVVRAAAKLCVWRVTPTTHAGYLGSDLPPTTTEEDLRRAFGGRVFRLELRDGMGRALSGGVGTVEILAEPKSADGTMGAAPTVDVDSVARRVRDEFKEELERLRAQAKIDAEEREAKAKRELEIERQRRRDEQDERDAKAKREREAEEARHKRDLEMMREASKSERERERERHEADMRRMEQASKDALAMQREMTTLILKSQEENTKIVVASLNAKGGGIEQFAQVAEVLNALKGDGEDPSVKMVGKLTEGLGSFAKMVTHEGRPHALPVGHAPGALPSGAPVATSRPVVSNPAPSPAVAPGALPPPTPQTLPDDLQAIMADMIASGLKPEEIVRAIRERKILLVPADEYADEFEEGEEDEELPPPRRTRATREASPAPAASSAPSDPPAPATPPTGGPAA